MISIIQNNIWLYFDVTKFITFSYCQGQAKSPYHCNKVKYVYTTALTLFSIENMRDLCINYPALKYWYVQELFNSKRSKPIYILNDRSLYILMSWHRCSNKVLKWISSTITLEPTCAVPLQPCQARCHQRFCVQQPSKPAERWDPKPACCCDLGSAGSYSKK